ncbi:MAG: hypothetical protein QW717_02705 [Candidatus Bathyarchaeia archaeon]
MLPVNLLIRASCRALYTGIVGENLALYEGFTEIGWLSGLLLCSGLNLATFISATILAIDSILIFERALVATEKTVDFT